MAATIEAEGGKRIPPEIMELTINLTPDAVDFALDFNQFEFDGIKLRLPAIYSKESSIAKVSIRKRLRRIAKKQKLPELSHKLDTVTIGNQKDLKPM